MKNKQSGFGVVELILTVLVCSILGLIVFVIVDTAEKNAIRKVLQSGQAGVFVAEQFVGNTSDGCQITRLPDLNGYVYRIKCPTSNTVSSDVPQGKTRIQTTVLDK